MRRRYRYNEATGKMEEVSLECNEGLGLQVVMKHPNISYESPITGEAVTTWAKRDYDMKAAGCVDAREAKEMAADARRYWKKPTDGLTLREVERHR